jgi:hypothetical protein
MRRCFDIELCHSVVHRQLTCTTFWSHTSRAGGLVPLPEPYLGSADAHVSVLRLAEALIPGAAALLQTDHPWKLTEFSRHQIRWN